MSNVAMKLGSEALFTHSDTVTVTDPITIKFIIVPMVTSCLTGRMGVEPILPVRWPVTLTQ